MSGAAGAVGRRLDRVPTEWVMSQRRRDQDQAGKQDRREADRRPSPVNFHLTVSVRLAATPFCSRCPPRGHLTATSAVAAVPSPNVSGNSLWE